MNKVLDLIQFNVTQSAFYRYFIANILNLFVWYFGSTWIRI